MTKRLPLLAGAAASCAALGLPAVAAAKTIELGQTKTPIAAPTCPTNVSLSNCNIVLAHTTAFQSTSDGVANPMKVTANGFVVAFSVGVSRLVSTATQERSLMHGLDEQWGGTPRVALTVLRPTGTNGYTVAGESAPLHLIPFFGRVIEEPLALPPSFTALTALPVKRGDVIGLTTSTWAPVLSFDLTANQFAYRQSRRANCTHPPATQTAQVKVGQMTPYECSYTGTRVQYTATEITNTAYPKTYVH